MASTSTNKQPLLVDHVLHTIVNLDLATNTNIDVSGSNTAELILDATGADGAVIEALYLISRGAVAHTVNLFLSNANDYLRPNQGFYIGSVVSKTTIGEFASFELPKVLTPVPQVGDSSVIIKRCIYLRVKHSGQQGSQLVGQSLMVLTWVSKVAGINAKKAERLW